MFHEKYFHIFTQYHYSSFRVKMSLNIGDKRSLFLMLKSKLGFYHVEPALPKTSPEKFTLTVDEMQQLPDIETTDSKEEIFCLKWTRYNGRRKVSVNLQTDTHKLNIVVYRYRNNLYLKGDDVDLKLTKYQSLLAKRATLTFSTSGALYWMKQLSIINKLWQERMFFSSQVFSDCTRDWKMSFEHNSVRKNLFPNACFCWDSRLPLHEMDQKFRFGGLIGFGNSSLDSVFRYSKVFRLHAILHDAAGAVPAQSGKGPGYCYMIGRGPHSCLLGHVTGLLFCLYVKLSLPSIFNSVDFWSSMFCIVLDVELTDKNVIKELGVFIDGSLQKFSFRPHKDFQT